MNTCYNAVDRHVDEGKGDQVAIIHDSPLTNTIQKLTYAELQKQVICPSVRLSIYPSVY